jgi:hypothetical protein
MSCGGSHLGFPIGIKYIKFVEDLPMIIPGQFVGPYGKMFKCLLLRNYPFTTGANISEVPMFASNNRHK